MHTPRAFALLKQSKSPFLPKKVGLSTHKISGFQKKTIYCASFLGGSTSNYQNKLIMKANKKQLLLILAGLFFTTTQLMAQSNDERRERREPPSIDEIFEHMDANEDGKLSKKEVKGPLSKHFDKVDTNEDGFISREELEKAPKPKRRERTN